MNEANAARPNRFVPSGVDAQTWIGFEQRIQERRYKALLDTINASVSRRDGMAARAALEEARELRPAAPELAALSARVALLPTAMPDAASATHLWSRPLGAAAMLIVGVGLVVGLETIRSDVSDRPASTPVTSAAPAAAAPVTTAAPASVDQAPAPNLVSRPAVESLAPAPAVEPRGEEPVGTTGLRRATIVEPRAADAPNRPTFRPAVDIEPVVPAGGEVPDDYVATSAGSESRAGYAEVSAPPSPSIAANVVRQPVPITQPPAATVASAAIAPRRDDARVTQVLNQYARAYDQLDTNAARAVWPTVDERALARAFAGLQSQDVSFDNCSIDVKGATANASCSGRASYVGKVGNRETRTEAREWNFQLKLQGDDWKIEKAETKRR